MATVNKVFIATSLDGYIADENDGIDWLHNIPNPEGNDMGYAAFMKGIDAIIMGRNTFETVCSFDIPWPYNKPVFVLSNSLNVIPSKYENKAQLISGTLKSILDEIERMGHRNIYIDGGSTIQSFLRENLIHEMTITRIPILLGKGKPLFGELNNMKLHFKCTGTTIFLNQVVQNTFEWIR